MSLSSPAYFSLSTCFALTVAKLITFSPSIRSQQQLYNHVHKLSQLAWVDEAGSYAIALAIYFFECVSLLSSRRAKTMIFLCNQLKTSVILSLLAESHCSIKCAGQLSSPGQHGLADGPAKAGKYRPSLDLISSAKGDLFFGTRQHRDRRERKPLMLKICSRCWSWFIIRVVDKSVTCIWIEDSSPEIPIVDFCVQATGQPPTRWSSSCQSPNKQGQAQFPTSSSDCTGLKEIQESSCWN